MCSLTCAQCDCAATAKSYRAVQKTSDHRGASISINLRESSLQSWLCTYGAVREMLEKTLAHVAAMHVEVPWHVDRHPNFCRLCASRLWWCPQVSWWVKADRSGALSLAHHLHSPLLQQVPIYRTLVAHRIRSCTNRVPSSITQNRKGSEQHPFL